MTDPKATDSDSKDQAVSTTPAKANPPTGKAVKKPRGNRRPWVLWIILFLTVVAVVLLALWNWHQWQQRQSMQQSVSYLEKTTERLERSSSEAGGQLDSRVQSLQSALNKQRDTISEQGRQIEYNARTLLESGNRTRTDWLLAEAEYLLRVANQRLQIENDIKGALAALQAADKVLHSTDDVGAFPVRKQVAKDILALKSIEAVDRTGLYLKLEAAMDAVANLTDKALSDGAGDSKDEDTSSDTAEDSKGEKENVLARGWAKTKQTLADAVRIRKLDEPVKPLLSPKQSVYARLNLRLMLEEAEMAVLAGNQVLYNRSLAKADEWLGNWYDDSHAPVRALRNTLKGLSGKDINPKLPDISKSLKLLKARMEGRGGSGDDGDNKSGNDDSAKSTKSPKNGDKAGDAS